MIIDNIHKARKAWDKLPSLDNREKDFPPTVHRGWVKPTAKSNDWKLEFAVLSKWFSTQPTRTIFSAKNYINVILGLLNVSPRADLANYILHQLNFFLPPREKKQPHSGSIWQKTQHFCDEGFGPFAVV